ncbi:MAG TPA: hypothetical protein VMZ00_15030 [Sporichthya sp.]|nr:hypothetical protein [Sporichthya sp.]
MSTLVAPTFEAAVAPVARPMARLRLTADTDPVTIGLQMANWLLLMLLMSGFLLATTMSDRTEPAGTTSGIGSAATR